MILGIVAALNHQKQGYVDWIVDLHMDVHAFRQRRQNANFGEFVEDSV